MNNAEFKTTHNKPQSGLHQRKSRRKDYSKRKRKMVGSGSGESVDQDLADIKMELLDIESEDDVSEDFDTKRLISSPSPQLFTIKSDRSKDLEESSDDENVWSISVQMFIPFLLAGFGMVAASLLLDVVQVTIFK